MATATVSRQTICSELVRAAGGNPRLSRFRSIRGDAANGILDVPDVTQPALDAAVAAYDQAVAEDTSITTQFGIGIQEPWNDVWVDTTFDLENRVRALEGQTPLTRRQFTDLLRTRYR